MEDRMRILFGTLLVLVIAGAALAGDDKSTSAPGATKSVTAVPPAKPAPGPVKSTPKTTDKAISAIDAQIAKAAIDKTKDGWRTKLPKPQAVAFTPARKYLAKMQTNKGPVVIEFMPDIAPMHVTNFIYLSRLGFYDGLKFHRVISGFMAQGGDPLGNGAGGPGYQFGSEFSPKARHDTPGLLSMANAGEGTDGSQFFLTFVATPWLNDKHTIFGKVTEGMDTLKKLEAAGSQGGETSEPLSITRVTIEVK
jgi:peptidyl-prolyl cis-trans isomerase B (cyclophilin B)